jgi:hypothetical protein
MQNLRALVDEKIANNRNYREAMLALIASREAIAFVGAGLSSALKYPSWNDLLEKLRLLADRVAPFNPPNAVKADVLQYAEAIKKHFQNNSMLPQFNNAIGREFMPRNGANCTTTHSRLIKLPFRSFVTTNYDDCLEQALNEFTIHELGKSRLDPGVVIKANKADRHLVSTFLRSIVDRVDKHQRRVGHIHGRYNDTANIILAASDYEDAYGLILKGSQPRNVPSSTLHRQLAWSLFATRQLVFFGCSMDDPYIKALLDMVTADLWEWNQPIHFVVLPIDENSVSIVDGLTIQFQGYGLQPVFFENCKGDFLNLDQLLDEAFERCPHDDLAASGSDSTSNKFSATHTQTPVPVKEPGFNKLALAFFKKIAKLFSRTLLFQKPTQSERKQEQTVGPEWLEEINKATVSRLKSDED